MRRAVLSVGRKNGKSALTAALVLAHPVGPEAIRNGEIYSAATEREQAAIVFKIAAQMVRADSELRSLIKIVDSTKTMVCMHNGSVYCAISAKAGTKLDSDDILAFTLDPASGEPRPTGVVIPVGSPSAISFV